MINIVKIFRKSFTVIALTGVLFLAISSCNKKLDIPSARVANEAGHWTSLEDARSGLMGLYGLFRAALADNNAYWMWGELRQGDFQAVSRQDLQAIIDGNLNASYSLIKNVSDWRRFYAIINACNLFIERVDSCMTDSRYTESYYKLDIAQARTLRAFAYFSLVRIWGDVPLITTSGEGGNFEQIARTGADTVLAFAEQELTEAAPRLPYLYSANDPDQLFPTNYYGEDQAYWLNAPMTRLAAYALLAHIAAWQGRYIDAAVFTEFIESNYSQSNLVLSTVDYMVSPTGLFAAGNNNYRQLIGFNFIQSRGETTTNGHFEQLTLANTTVFQMSKQLPDIYMPKATISEVFPPGSGNDQRFGIDNRFTPALLYTTYFENYNAEVPVFKKIRVLDGGAGEGSYAVYNSSIIFTRLEELFLLRAEALAVTGNEGRALEILNNLRSRRGLLPVSIGPESDLLTEIFAERRRELAGEGWRWFDLVRYNRLKRNDPEFNRLLDEGGIYWPVSQDVLTRNKQIQQNPFWR